MPEKLNVLFVCLGNICRSTMAEGIFQSVAKKEPYSKYFGKIDSCGTGELYLSSVAAPHTPVQRKWEEAKRSSGS